MSNDHPGPAVRRLSPDGYAMPTEPMMRPAPAGYGEPGVPYSPPPGQMHAISAPRAPTHFDQPPGAAAPAMPPYAVAPPPAAPAASPAAVQAAQGQPVVAHDPETIVDLSKPYLAANGEQVTQVRFRRPLGKEIAKYGNPIKPIVNDRGIVDDVDIKWDVMAKLVSALSDPPLPGPTVDRFEWVDLDSCAGVIARFFVRTA